MFRNSKHERKLSPRIHIRGFWYQQLGKSGCLLTRSGSGKIVQYIWGEVSVAPSATNNWAAARLNQVLTPSEDVWTATNSRAEINVGDAFIRMNAEVSNTL